MPIGNKKIRLFLIVEELKSFKKTFTPCSTTSSVVFFKVSLTAASLRSFKHFSIALSSIFAFLAAKNRLSLSTISSS